MTWRQKRRSGFRDELEENPGCSKVEMEWRKAESLQRGCLEISKRSWARDELAGGFLRGGYTLDGSAENVVRVDRSLR